MAGAHERPEESLAGAGDVKLERWIANLQHEPKRRYARNYADFVLGRRRRPRQPAADWAVRVEGKVDRLLSGADRGGSRPPAAADRGGDHDDFVGILGMLGFDE